MERNAVKERKHKSFDRDLVKSATNSSCEVINWSYASTHSKKSRNILNLSLTPSQSKKCHNIIHLCTSLTSQKSWEVDDTSKTSLKSPKNRPQTKIKQKQDKPERKIILQESLCLIDDQARPNLKCIISGSCRTAKHKCQEKFSKCSISMDSSKSDKPSKCHNKNSLKTDLLVPENLKKHIMDFYKSENHSERKMMNEKSVHVPEEIFDKLNMDYSKSKRQSKHQTKNSVNTSLPPESNLNEHNPSKKYFKKQHKTSLHETGQKLDNIDFSKGNRSFQSAQNTNLQVPEHKLNKNTTESLEKESCPNKSLHIPVKYRDRIKPCCFRRKCSTSAMDAQMRSCWSTPVCKDTKKSHKQKEEGKQNQKGSKNHRRNKRISSEKQHKKTRKSKVCVGELSPISMSPLPQSISSSLNISYEDISMDSFATQSEEDLDSLIKRTKERERSMTLGYNFHKFSVPLTVQDRPKASTPNMHHYDNEDSSTIYTEDMDVSVHSLSTVVLTPYLGAEAYSPTMSPTDLLNYKRNSQDLATLSVCESDCEIEAHPKIEPYSPSTSPGRLICPQNVQSMIKKETHQDMQVEGEICSMPSIGIKQETIDLIEVKRELRTPSPKIYNVSEHMISEFKVIKKEGDSSNSKVLFQ